MHVLPRARRRRIHPTLIAVALTALALRLLHFRAVRPLLLDRPAPPGMDRWLSVEVASAIARGEWLGGWAVPYDSSPGYSYLLALLYRLSGDRWVGPVTVQLALGAATPLLVAAVVARLRDDRAALVAALLCALYLPAIFYEGLLVKFALVPFATAALLLATERLRDGASRWVIGAGLALGALVLLRPSALLVAPVVLWSAVRRVPARVGLSRVALLAAGAAVLVGPMIVRNHLAAQRGVAPALGGIHFYIGSNPRADGEYVVLPRIRPDIVGHVVDARREAERRVGHRLTPEEVSRFWLRAGLAFIANDPVRYLLLELRKVWFVLEANESGSFGDDFDDLRAVSPVLQLPLPMFGVIMPLAVVGVAGCVRRRGWLLPAFAATVAASLLPFFVAGRYRLLLAPPMIALAALGIDDLVRLARAARPGALAAVAAGLLLLAILFGAGDRQVLTLLATMLVGGALVAWLPSFLHVSERAQAGEDGGIDLGPGRQAGHGSP